MRIECDENHAYFVDGKPIPGTNEILNLYFPPSKFFTQEAREAGIARHLWADFIARGLEPAEDPDPRIAGEIAGFRKFLAEVQPKYVSGEVPYFDGILNVCGTPDLVAEIHGRLSVCDYKPKVRSKRTALQTASYFLMLRRNGIMVVDRYELRLLPSNYRLEQHQDQGDLKRWPILVSAFHAANFYR